MSNTLTIRQANRNDFEAIAQFIAEFNHIPTHHVLHCDTKEINLLADLNRLADRNEERFVIALNSNNKIIGIHGGEFDHPLQEVWFWGPIVNATNWIEVSSLLHEHFCNITPDLKEMSIFLNILNTQAKQFYEQLGFEKPSINHQYTLSTYRNTNINTTSCVPFKPAHQEVVNEIHLKAFPGTYYSTQEMLDLIKEDSNWNNGSVYIEDDQVLGYIFNSMEVGAEGYIHFIAVKEGIRGKGIGSQLMQKALDWFFNEKKVEKVNLAVRDANNARQLYEKFGFTLTYTGWAASKKR